MCVHKPFDMSFDRSGLRYTSLAVYLIECFADWYTAPFQLDMHQRKAVHKHGNIIAILTFSCVHLILIYDLKAVVMDILLINECDILR